MTVDPKLLQRLPGASQEDLANWVDGAITTLGQYFSEWRRQRAPELMDEAKYQTQILYALLDELAQRRPGITGRVARQTKQRVT